jgi:hypothetical protein
MSFLNDTEDGPFMLYTAEQRQAIYGVQARHRGVRVTPKASCVIIEGLDGSKIGRVVETIRVKPNGEVV